MYDFNDIKNAITENIAHFHVSLFKSTLSKWFCIWEHLMYISIKNFCWTIMNRTIWSNFDQNETFKSRRVIKIQNIKRLSKNKYKKKWYSFLISEARNSTRAIIELSRFQSRACVYCSFNSLDTLTNRERPQKQRITK